MRVRLLLASVLLVSGCAEPQVDTQDPPPDGDTGPDGGPMLLTSTAFDHEGPIPSRHSCDDAGVSPALVVDGVSAQAVTLALIMEDPDAPSGTVLHWTFWDVPAGDIRIEEAADIAGIGGVEGQAYRGPCPPDGEHRYFFYLYAVNQTIDLAAGSSVEQLRTALDGRVVEQASMYGTYCRPNVPNVGCVAA